MTDLDRVREAIRFAEEYGYREWLAAQDELNAHLKEDAADHQKMREDQNELANLREENARLRARRADAEVFRAWAEDYKSQRDNLLAALRDIENYSTEYRAKAIADTAIAEVEGETT